MGGVDILSLSEPQMKRVRGNRIAMIFQEPMTALNPLMLVGRQIAETYFAHRKDMSAADVSRRVRICGSIRSMMKSGGMTP